MNICKVLALLLGAAATEPRLQVPAPPELQSVLLSAEEDRVVQIVMDSWNLSRPAGNSPLVVTREAYPYDVQLEPLLRVELLRRGTEAALSEQLLSGLRRNNSQLKAIDSPALGAAKRIRFHEVLLRGMDPKSASDASLANLGEVRAIARPATSGSSAIVFYGVGPQMLNRIYSAAHLAFIRDGKVRWDHEFGDHGLEIDRDAASGPATLPVSVDDIAVLSAAIDRRFPDPKIVPHVVNETSLGKTRVFLPPIALSRPVRWVMRETWSTNDLSGGPGVLSLSMPVYTDRNHATLGYSIMLPAGGKDVEGFSGTMYADRTSGRWLIGRDDSQLLFTTKVDATMPIRVGGAVKPPLVIKRVEPDIKPGIRKGVVMVEMRIDAQGRPIGAEVLTSQDPAVVNPVIAAVMNWQFKPGTLEGKPVPVIHVVTVTLP